LPYKTCWFDFTSGIHNVNWKPSEGFVTSTKRAVLVQEIDTDFLKMDFFVFQNNTKQWVKAALNAFVSIGKSIIDKIPDGCDFNGVVQVNQKREEANIILVKQRNFNINQDIIGSIIKSIMTVNMGLMLLSCKNITTKTVSAPDKLNKKRIKQGKQPLFSYHTLVIKPVDNRQKSIPKHLWENRIHLQRGHFKTYTAEKPLFGHITGRFWWQPHVRGRNKNGMVMKDYSVQTDLN
jgi:hypothetical protein